MLPPAFGSRTAGRLVWPALVKSQASAERASHLQPPERERERRTCSGEAANHSRERSERRTAGVCSERSERTLQWSEWVFSID